MESNTNNMRMFRNTKFQLSLRSVQAVFAIIVLGLAGYVAHWWSGYWNSSSPSEINFLIFCAVWTLLALGYLIFADLRPEHKIARAVAVLAVDALTMIFWFAGFIAVAVFIHDRGCFGGVCSAAKAAAVFGAFEWLLFVVTTALYVHRLRLEKTSGSKTVPVAGA